MRAHEKPRGDKSRRGDKHGYVGHVYPGSATAAGGKLVIMAVIRKHVYLPATYIHGHRGHNAECYETGYLGISRVPHNPVEPKPETMSCREYRSSASQSGDDDPLVR